MQMLYPAEINRRAGTPSNLTNMSLTSPVLASNKIQPNFLATMPMPIPDALLQLKPLQLAEMLSASKPVPDSFAKFTERSITYGENPL